MTINTILILLVVSHCIHCVCTNIHTTAHDNSISIARYYRNFVTENTRKAQWSLARFPLDALETVQRILIDEKYRRVPRIGHKTMCAFNQYSYLQGGAEGWIEIRRFCGEDMWNIIEVPNNTISAAEFDRLMQVLSDAGVYIMTPQVDMELIPPIVPIETDWALDPNKHVVPDGMSYNYITDMQIKEQARELRE